MWKTGRQEHFSDDKLLSCADGELSGRTERAVSRHLRECWTCRARLSELEEQAQVVARLMAKETFPGPERTEQAIQRFLERKNVEGKNVPPPVPDNTHRFTFARRFSVQWAAAAMALATICAGGVWFWMGHSGSELQPREVLSRMQGFEETAGSSKSVVRQVVNVEVRQVRPGKTGLKSELEVWSDGSTGRYALRWTGQGGSLRYGAWRSATDERYIHNPAVPVPLVSTGAQHNTVSLLDLSSAGVDLKRVEAALLRWIQAQVWRQVSVARDYALFVNQRGVTIRAERGRSMDGALILRLVATRTTGRTSVEFVMEVNPVSYQPQLTAVRFEAPEGAVEVRLAFARSGPVPPGLVTPAVFEPNPTVVSLTPKRSRPVLPPRAAESTPARHSVSEADELELRWWLHRVGACTKERPEISRGHNGRIKLRAVVATQERKRDLLAAVMSLGSDFPVDAEIEVRSVQSRSGYQGGAGESKISGDALAAVDLAYAESFALVQLAERYGSDQIAGFDPKSRRLLEGMIRDHLAAVRSAGSHAKRLILPVLAPPASPPANETAASDAINWNEHTFALFRTVDEMDNIVQALASGQGVTAGEKSRAEQRLRSVLAALDERIQALDWVTARNWRR